MVSLGKQVTCPRHKGEKKKKKKGFLQKKRQGTHVGDRAEPS